MSEGCVGTRITIHFRRLLNGQASTLARRVASIGSSICLVCFSLAHTRQTALYQTRVKATLSRENSPAPRHAAPPDAAAGLK